MSTAASGGARRDPGSLRARQIVAGVLLAATFVGLLWVPSYAHLTPPLGGIPFFYWYSVLWLIINAICQVIAYRLLRPATAGAR